MLELLNSTRRELEAWACAEYPRESCGLLVGSPCPGGARVVEAVRARNLERARPCERFELDPADWVAADHGARARGLDIVGIWHSHPDHPPLPSESDRLGAWEGYAYLIVQIGRRGPVELRSWRLQGEELCEEAICSDPGA